MGIAPAKPSRLIGTGPLRTRQVREPGTQKQEAGPERGSQAMHGSMEHDWNFNLLLKEN